MHETGCCNCCVRSLGHSLEMVARLKQVRSRKPVGGESSGKSDSKIKRWPAVGREGGVSPADKGLVMKMQPQQSG